MTFEIYWDDLTSDAQERLQALHHENIDLSPLAIIECEPDEEEEETKPHELSPEDKHHASYLDRFREPEGGW